MQGKIGLEEHFAIEDTIIEKGNLDACCVFHHMVVGQDIAVGSVYDNTGTNTMTKDFIRGVEKTFEWTAETIRLIALLINRWIRRQEKCESLWGGGKTLLKRIEPA